MWYQMSWMQTCLGTVAKQYLIDVEQLLLSLKMFSYLEDLDES